jgi:hypothetical protein
MNHVGLYEGVIMSVRDPKLRFRFGVYVHGVMTDSLTADSYPLAEVLAPTRGAFSPLKVGDLVLVMFIGGDDRFPVIMSARQLGESTIPSTPTDYQIGQLAADSDPDELNRSLQRIQHIDERGNLFELSEVSGEARVRMKSGGAEIFVTMEGDKAVVSATGTVTIKSSGKVAVEAGTVDVNANTVNIDTHDTNLLGSDAGRTRIASNKKVVIAGVNDIQVPGDLVGLKETGNVDIGAEIQQIRGVAVPGTLPSQSASANILSRDVNIGVAPSILSANPLAPTVAIPPLAPPLIPWVPGYNDTRAGDQFPIPFVGMKPTMNINIRCAAYLKIEGGQIDVTSHSGSTTVIAPNVSVQALNNVSVYAAKDVSVTSLGALTIEGITMGVTVRSALEVTVQAPKINLGVI